MKCPMCGKDTLNDLVVHEVTNKEEIKIRLEQIKEELQNNRKPYCHDGVMVGKTVTVAEWAIEETVCALLDMLESDKE